MLKTNIDKNTLPQIQGLTKSSNVFNEFKNEDIFRPNRTVLRTPPKTVSTEVVQVNIEQVTSKRSRSETTSELEQTHKKRQFEQNQCKHVLEKPKFSEDLVWQMFDNLDSINELTNRTIGTFSSDDQARLKEAHNDIHKLLTIMMFNYSSIEKENMTLKSQLVSNDLISGTLKDNKHEDKINNEMIKNTYVNVLTKNMNRNQDTTHANFTGNNNDKEGEPWRTPTTTNKHETVIHIENVAIPKRNTQAI